MGTDNVQSKKRKGATEAQPKPKKQKKSDGTAAAQKVTKKALDAAVAPIDDTPAAAKTKVPRMRAQDLFDEDEPSVKAEAAKEKKNKKKGKPATEPHSEVAAAPVEEKPKKTKKNKAVEEDAAPATEVEVAVAQPKGKKSKKAKTIIATENPDDEEEKPEEEMPIAADKKSKKVKASKKQKEPSPEVAAKDQDDDDEEEDADEDDQTAALLAGFESEGDESDAVKEDEDFDSENLRADIPGVLSKKLKKASSNEDEPGVIFVGRIPHGFYEPQMKGYFSQFGTVKRLRVSRNKKTGASKHYAFIEFASSEVADIVAKTMDKYLMFGHILQCKVIPSEQVHPDMFKGAGQRFKAIPRNKMAGAQMARGAVRATWEKRVENEKKRRQKKDKQAKANFDYEYEAPILKAVEDVPKKTSALEDGSTQPQQIEASAEDSVAGAIEAKDSNKSAEGVLEPVEPASDKKTKKGKKSKAGAAPDNVEEAVDAATDKETPKVKKTKDVERPSAVETTPLEKKRKTVSTEQGAAKPKKAKKAKA